MNKIMKSVISMIVIITTLTYISPVYAISKESVYSNLDSTGKKYKTIVTTKDEETTQEETDKDLPLETKITYKLDGKNIKPQDLAGKSGKLNIKIEYKNKSAKQVTINSKKETMYTPFVVALGTIIDNEKNSNIKVSDGGRIIENGDKTIVIGLVFPGLDKDLNLSGELSDIEIPSSIEITMDAKDFEMKNIITYASPKVFSKDIDWSKFDGLFDKANELQTGINKIEDGAKTLNKAMATLKKGTETLDKGTSKLNDGANKLNKGVNTLKKGTNTLNNGASRLSKGASDLSNGASSLNVGARTLKRGIDELNQKAKVLAKGMNTISNSVTKLNNGAATIKSQVDALGAELATYVGKAAELQTLIDTNTATINALPDDAQSIKIKGLLQKNNEALEQEKSLLQKTSSISKLVDGIDILSDGLDALNEGTKNLPTQSKTLTAGIKQLVNGAGDLAEGTKSLATGASQLNSGASDLAKGTKSMAYGVNNLSKGSKTLAKGTKDLSKGTSNLVDGASKLENGSKVLYNGINRFNKQGISKIIKFVNTDLKNLVIRGKKMEELAKDYDKFASDERKEEISFISMVDSIKNEKEEKEEN